MRKRIDDVCVYPMWFIQDFFLFREKSFFITETNSSAY